MCRALLVAAFSIFCSAGCHAEGSRTASESVGGRGSGPSHEVRDESVSDEGSADEGELDDTAADEGELDDTAADEGVPDERAPVEGAPVEDAPDETAGESRGEGDPRPWQAYGHASEWRGDRASWLRQVCVDSPVPHPDYLDRCCAADLFTEAERVDAARRARNVSSVAREEMSTALSFYVLDFEGEVRTAALASLVALGHLSTQAAALVPPSRAWLEARAARLLRRRGHDPAELCEEDLHIVRSTGETLELLSDGNRCPDGAWLETRFRLSARGLALLSVERRHN